MRCDVCKRNGVLRAVAVADFDSGVQLRDEHLDQPQAHGACLPSVHAGGQAEAAFVVGIAINPLPT